ncbi:transposase [Candidatus Pacearchaeota archaeon]|nr:transposase [Candidatus Pacearchaeota archaeon]|tara:strand:+ start:28600 stop:29373 length:774 start_codon:yes stop_codon:yes gene_type:complete
MNPIILASKKDPAGLNIVDNLKKLGCKIPIHLVETEIIHAENIDKTLNADFIIWASKHQSEKEIKTLTVHPIGNFNKAEFGGKPKTICPSNPLILKHFFQTLNKNNNLDYKVSMEATHHGPHIETPSLFIEIGSTKKQWQDKKAGELIAKTILESIKTFSKNSSQVAIGIGGPHYCPNFNKIQLENKFALSHIIPEYALPINEKMIQQTIDKTTKKPEYAILDWKGLGKAEQKNKILEILKDFNLKIIKTSEAKENL